LLPVRSWRRSVGARRSPGEQLLAANCDPFRALIGVNVFLRWFRKLPRHRRPQDTQGPRRAVPTKAGTHT
jgi:hypothetical protein